MIHQPQNTNSLRDTGNNTMHMVFDGELAVKLHAKDVEVGTSKDKNPRQGLVRKNLITGRSTNSTNFTTGGLDYLFMTVSRI